MKTEYDYKQYDSIFEYYMRRGKRLYFRNDSGKMVIEKDFFYIPFMRKNPNYGDKFEINFHF